jgi:hypothetical protein
MSRTYKIHCLSTAVSPITHGRGSEGNETVIARRPIVTPTGVRWVPVLSGNAMRHKAVREPGARFLVERWGLEGKLSMRQLNFLFHGGTLSESTARQDPASIARLHRLFPLLRLIGGSLPDAILPGSLHVLEGVLCCRETYPILRSIAAGIGAAGMDVPANLRPAETFVDSMQYVRMDAGIDALDLAAGRDAFTIRGKGEDAYLALLRLPGLAVQESEIKNGKWWVRTGVMHLAEAKEIAAGAGAAGAEVDYRSRINMPIQVQAVVSGSVFMHGFILNHVSELELGALLLSLSLWRESGGTMGMAAGRGQGRLDVRIHMDDAARAPELMQAYADHVDASRAESLEWLAETFEPKQEEPKAADKPAGPKRGRKKPAETAEPAA